MTCRELLGANPQLSRTQPTYSLSWGLFPKGDLYLTIFGAYAFHASQAIFLRLISYRSHIVSPISGMSLLSEMWKTSWSVASTVILSRRLRILSSAWVSISYRRVIDPGLYPIDRDAIIPDYCIHGQTCISRSLFRMSVLVLRDLWPFVTSENCDQWVRHCHECRIRHAWTLSIILVN